MPACKECKKSFGFMELKGGVCKGCSTIRKCRVCGEEFKGRELISSACQICFEKEKLAAEEAKKRSEEELAESQREQERRTEQLRSMPLSTVLEIPGMRTLRYVSLVRGGTVRSKHIGSDILAGLKSSTVGGEIIGYTKLMADAREEALFRLKEDAYSCGANAVIGVSFASATLETGMTEIYAIGTGIVVEEA